MPKVRRSDAPDPEVDMEGSTVTFQIPMYLKNFIRGYAAQRHKTVTSVMRTTIRMMWERVYMRITVRSNEDILDSFKKSGFVLDPLITPVQVSELLAQLQQCKRLQKLPTDYFDAFKGDTDGS